MIKFRRSGRPERTQAFGKHVPSIPGARHPIRVKRPVRRTKGDMNDIANRASEYHVSEQGRHSFHGGPLAHSAKASTVYTETGSIQTYTVVTSGTYEIAAYGAQGGANISVGTAGGSGAY